MLITGIIVFEKLFKRRLVIKNSHIALTIYVSILLVCSIIYLLLPKSELDANSYQGDLQQQAEAEQLLTEINAGNIKKVKDYTIGEQSFKYDRDEIYLKDLIPEDGWFEIVIDRKSNDDGLIEAHYLNTGMYLNGVNVTNKLESLRFKVVGDELIVENPNPTNVNLKLYKKEFPITQFTSRNGDVDSSEYHISFNVGYNVIYLRIPNNVLVKNETPYTVEYVEN